MEAMPPAVLAQLRRLGENLAIARKRRREPRKAWAQRIGISEPTLTRLERGDPGVAMGLYATALWLIGRASGLADLAAPESDLGALEQEVRVARSRAVRRPLSIDQRLGQATPVADGTTPRPPAVRREDAA